jgi:hypothetical protein
MCTHEKQSSYNRIVCLCEVLAVYVELSGFGSVSFCY